MDDSSALLAQVLQQYQQSQQRFDAAQQAPSYINNSGVAGVAAVLA